VLKGSLTFPEGVCDIHIEFSGKDGRIIGSRQRNLKLEVWLRHRLLA
jgi:ribosomal protein L21E